MSYTQIMRIRNMENILDKAREVLDKVYNALENNQITPQLLEDFYAIQPDIDTVVEYFGGKDGRKDFDDDRKGLLPPCLKRGVLSEDAVYELLTDNIELKEQLMFLKD